MRDTVVWHPAGRGKAGRIRNRCVTRPSLRQSGYWNQRHGSGTLADLNLFASLCGDAASCGARPVSRPMSRIALHPQPPDARAPSASPRTDGAPRPQPRLRRQAGKRATTRGRAIATEIASGKARRLSSSRARADSAPLGRGFCETARPGGAETGAAPPANGLPARHSRMPTAHPSAPWHVPRALPQTARPGACWRVGIDAAAPAPPAPVANCARPEGA